MDYHIPEFSNIKKAENIQRQIGTLIKQIRTNRGLTQKELGKLCNIAESQIGQYEIGIRKPKLETLSKITKVLNIQTDYFLSLVNYELTQDEVDKILNGIKNGDLQKARMIEQHSLRSDEEKKQLDEIHDRFLNELSNPFSMLSILDNEIEQIKNPPFDSNFALAEYLELNLEGQKEVSKLVKKLLQIPKYTDKTQ